jgi:hypothetical protein
MQWGECSPFLSPPFFFAYRAYPLSVRLPQRSLRQSGGGVCCWDPVADALAQAPSDYRVTREWAMLEAALVEEAAAPSLPASDFALRDETEFRAGGLSPQRRFWAEVVLQASDTETSRRLLAWLEHGVRVEDYFATREEGQGGGEWY